MPKKVTRSIPEGEWGSQVSKYPADSILVGINSLTSGSKNYETHENGALTKRQGSVQYSTLSSAAVDQYEAIFSDGVRHLLTVQAGTLEYSSGDGITNSVVNGSGFSTAGNFEMATITDRIYLGNGVNAGQVYDKTAVYGGAAPATVPRLKAMGCQVPSTTATAAVGIAGLVPVGSYTYKITYMYYESEESNGSAASNLVSPGILSQIDLTAVPIGDYGVTSRKVYRDNNDGVYRLVGEISDNTTTTFADNADIGTALIPTDNGIPPVFGQIVNFLDRAWISDIVGEPHTIRHSEAGQPNVHRANNFIVCNERDPITTGVVFLDRIVVFNRNSMGQVLGRTSSTFRYAEIQSSVGCVDSRTVQTRIIRGVPHLVWLSDKGIYAYNGNSVEYISEPIEDLINFNIQQGVQTKGQNSQTSQSDFQAGTASGGIDLTSDPGTITTPEPSRLWNDQADWEGGSTETNLSTKETFNLLQMPVQNEFSINEGTLSGLEIFGASLRIPPGTSQPNLSIAETGDRISLAANPNAYAQEIIIDHDGTIDSVTMYTYKAALDTGWKFDIYDNTAGAPGSSLYSSSFVTPVGSGAHTAVFSPSLSVSAGTYWLSLTLISNPGFPSVEMAGNIANSDTTHIGIIKKLSIGSWLTATPFIAIGPNAGNTAITLSHELSFTQTPIAGSGQWLSEIHDSKSDSISTTLQLTSDGVSYGAGKTSTTTLEGSDVSNFFGGAEVSEAFVDLPQTPTFTDFSSVSGKRYWRVRIQLNSDNTTQAGPFMQDITLRFDAAATWESEAIDCTADVTTYNSLDIVKSEPGSTTVTTKIATSADDISYPDGFVTFGTEVVRRYVKIQLVFDNTSDRSTTPAVASVDLNWTIVANLISSEINTGVTPAGWDIFQASSSLNGGTLLFEMRSAASGGALSGATWYTVTSGNFPTTSLPILQYVQWRTTLTSTSGNLPEVEAVVINWLVSLSSPIRASSLFFDKHYRLAAAKFGSDVNNVEVVLDPSNKWRINEDINISTSSLFFNIPYYGDANAGKILKRFEGNLDLGTTNIEFDVRSRADDFTSQFQDNRDKQKVMLDMVVTGKNTGATYTFYYSVDIGVTWVALRDATGSTSFTADSDGGRFTKRFKAEHQSPIGYTGRTVMARAVSNDANEVELHKFKIRALLRKGEPIG